MTRYIYDLALLIPTAEDARVNAWLQRNGFGTENVKRMCIPVSASDTAEATHLCGSAPVSQDELDCLSQGLSENAAVKYKVGPRGSKPLPDLLAENNVRLRPPPDDDI